MASKLSKRTALQSFLTSQQSRTLQRYSSASASDSVSTGLLEYEETSCDRADRTNEATAVVVHGLLGSGRNWRGFSKLLAKELSRVTDRLDTNRLSRYPAGATGLYLSAPWRFWLVDQRCHGHSCAITGFKPPNTVQAAAGDLSRLLDHKLPSAGLEAIIGHSLGGKVVMELLKQQGEGLQARQVWVLDSVVGAARPEDGEPTDVKRVLSEIQKIEMPIPSRDWLYQHLESRGFSAGFRLWMGSNLQARHGAYHWTFRVECVDQLYESYQDSEYWDLIEDLPSGSLLNLVRAARSDRWSAKHWERLERAQSASAGRLTLHILPNAGHWLHADNPEGLREMLCNSLAKRSDFNSSRTA